jgi:hypothetical protein
MDTLIYKRTHTGDPNKSGVFGCHGCMGQVRRRRFDAVIGVGGKRPDRGHEGIAFKVTWVGINPSKTDAPNDSRGPLVEFECFVLWDEAGPDLRTLAPNLFRYMFEDRHVRHVMSRSLPNEMQEEVIAILRLAEEHRDDVPRSKAPSRSQPAEAHANTSPKRKC